MVTTLLWWHSVLQVGWGRLVSSPVSGSQVGPALSVCHDVYHVAVLIFTCTCVFYLVGIVNIVADTEVEVCRQIKAISMCSDVETTECSWICITNLHDIFAPDSAVAILVNEFDGTWTYCSDDCCCICNPSFRLPCTCLCIITSEVANFCSVQRFDNR